MRWLNGHKMGIWKIPRILVKIKDKTRVNENRIMKRQGLSGRFIFLNMLNDDGYNIIVPGVGKTEKTV
jgi:hypothetical protein